MHQKQCDMNNYVLHTTNLSFSYSKETQIRFDNLQLQPLQHTLVLGDSGAGKSTLLHLLGGLSRPDTGTVSIIDQDIYALNDSKLDLFRAAHIGFIFQDAHMLKNLTIVENIALAQHLAKNQVKRTEIMTILDTLQLAEKGNNLPNELSRGQLQRAAIARALINRPKILLADEPTAALDDNNTQKVLALLLDAAQTYGATLLIATHDKRIKDHFSNTYIL